MVAALPPSACVAPQLQLYLYANGDVGPCCRNRVYGNVGRTSLRDIWTGVRRRRLVERLGEQDYSLGCQMCEVEHQLEGRAASYSSMFDHWAGELGLDPEDTWPTRMEFELSNTCNLQCVQCSGDLSSSIRSRREHRSPLPKAYGEAFFDELPEFLAHLRQASFVGGEPFLSSEHHRVWSLIAECSPDLPCVVVTNATQWNERVESVLDRLRVQPFLSIDGASKAVYESIRVGADFDSVMRNVERFRQYCAARAVPLTIVFCVMPDNIHELPEMLLFAEERGIHLTTSIVRDPADRSVAHLPVAQVEAILAELLSRSPEMESLVLNRATWLTEIDRVRGWVGAGQAHETSVRWIDRHHKILMFSRRSPVQVDVSAARAAAGEMCGDGVVHEVRIGPDERARDCSESLAAALGLPLEQLEGQTLSVIQSVVRRYEVIEESDAVYRALFELDDRRGSLVMYPRRDDAGRCDEVVALWSFGPVLR